MACETNFEGVTTCRGGSIYWVRQYVNLPRRCGLRLITEEEILSER
jgi:hypothetical protein